MLSVATIKRRLDRVFSGLLIGLVLVVKEHYKTKDVGGELLNKMLKTIFRQFSSSAGTKTKLGILGVPFSKGQSKGGVEQAPDFLRQNGLVSMLQESSRGGCLLYLPEK